jgi:hypothetical protein
MKLFGLCSAVTICLFCPLLGKAQNTGRIECARDDGYVYLYSSVTTLDVRATLQCGAPIQIVKREDDYFVVRTAKGETGFVPLTSVVVLKDQMGTGLPAPPADSPARERMHYDEKSPETSPSARSSVPGFVLLKDMPIRVKITKTISSATALVGDPVEFEVLDDHFLEEVLVISKGAKATGVIATAEPKKRFGKGGRLAFNITSLRMTNGQPAPLRCYQDVSGSSNTASDAVLPLASGKDVAVPQDTEFTALIDGNIPLKREAFAIAKDAATPATPAQALQPH